MKVLLQRVLSAKVTVDNQIHGCIDKGLLMFVGVTHEDDEEIVAKVANKVSGLRIFEDEQGKTNLGLAEVNGKVLSISQFTLYANCSKGKRPSFTDAANPEIANKLYEYFNSCLEANGYEVEKGVFGAEMLVDIVNDGPFTIMIDSKEL
jgi:D-tyrosyl-tRNA(Tyr) deacylase